MEIYSDLSNAASKEFENLWDEGINILPEDINNVRDETYLNKEITPFELYIKLLIEYFSF